MRALASVSVVVLCSLVCPKAFSNPGSGKAMTLADAFTAALKAAPEINVRLAEISFQNADLNEKQSDFLPKIGASAIAGRFNDRQLDAATGQAPNVAQQRDDYQFALTARQNLYASFETTYLTSASSAQLTAAKARLLAAQSEIKYQVTKAYFYLQKTTRELEAENSLKSLRKKQTRNVLTRIRQGKASNREKTLLLLEDETQVISIAKLQADFQQGALVFNRLIGSEPNAPIVLANDLETAYELLNRQPALPFKEALKLAIKNNPELLELIGEEISANNDLKAAQSKYGAKLDLKFEAKANSDELAAVTERDNFGYGVQLELSLPIFSGLGNFSANKKLKARQLEYVHRQTQVKEDILKRLGATYATLKSSEIAIKSGRQSIKLSELSTKEAKQLYVSGRLELQRVLESYRKQLDVRLDLYKSIHERVLALAEIKKIVGQ